MSTEVDSLDVPYPVWWAVQRLVSPSCWRNYRSSSARFHCPGKRWDGLHRWHHCHTTSQGWWPQSAADLETGRLFQRSKLVDNLCWDLNEMMLWLGSGLLINLSMRCLTLKWSSVSLACPSQNVTNSLSKGKSGASRKSSGKASSHTCRALRNTL